MRGVIHNFGPSRADGVLVRLTVDGRLGPEQSVDLPVGEDVPVVFNQQFSTPGDHVVEMSMDNDPLALDDHRFLVVAGSRVAERAAGGWTFQVRALPGRDRLPGPGTCAHRRALPDSRA